MDDAARIVILSEVKEILDREHEIRGELNYEQKLAHEHSKLFARISVEKAKELSQKLSELKKLTPTHVVKIVDVLPTNADDVRTVFAKERFQLEKEEIDKIIELVTAYSG